MLKIRTDTEFNNKGVAHVHTSPEYRYRRLK